MGVGGTQLPEDENVSTGIELGHPYVGRDISKAYHTNGEQIIKSELIYTNAEHKSSQTATISSKTEPNALQRNKID